MNNKHTYKQENYKKGLRAIFPICKIYDKEILVKSLTKDKKNKKINKITNDRNYERNSNL